MAKVEEVQAIMVGVEVSQIRMAIFYVGTSFYDYDYTSILNYIYRVTGTCTGTTGTCSAVHVRTCMYTQKSFNMYVHTRFTCIDTTLFRKEPVVFLIPNPPNRKLERSSRFIVLYLGTSIAVRVYSVQ